MGPDPQVGYHLTNPLIVFAPHLSMTIMKVGDQCLDSRTFLSLSLSLHTHSHIHTALIDAGSDSTTLWLKTASPFGHSAVKLQCGQVAGGAMIR